MILVCFNSRPASWLGAGGTLSLVWTKGIVVSILAQSLCWAWVAVTIVLLCFNSHSTSSAGCNSVRSSFNPRPAYWLGAGGGIHNPDLFQSSPNLSAGRRWRYILFSVSILAQPLRLGAAGRIVVFGRGQGFQSSTQPLGWVQVAVILPLLCFNPHPTSRLGAVPHRWQFQSSPNLSAGCSATSVAESLVLAPVSILIQPIGWVQSPDSQVGSIFLMVSILTQPLGWVQPNSRVHYLGPLVVSILTQPMGWVQLEPASGYKRGLVFQSSSSFLAGCSFSCQYRDLIGRRFQSSPNLSAGCSHSMVAGIWDRQFQSSTQPIGWVQPVSVPVSLIAALFQSSPNLSVGCRGLWTTRCFNPHPTSRLGAASTVVSILTQPLRLGAVW